MFFTYKSSTTTIRARALLNTNLHAPAKHISLLIAGWYEFVLVGLKP